MMKCQKFYIVQFITEEGNGYSILAAGATDDVYRVFKNNSAFKGAKLVSFKEFIPNEQQRQVLYEGLATMGASAYAIAVMHGFVGSEEDWLKTLKGDSAYIIAVQNGYHGSVQEWLESLKGLSAFEVAVANGYVGTEEEWLASLKGDSAYTIAVQLGFEGTIEEWIASLEGDSAYDIYVKHTTDVPVKTPEEWLDSNTAYYAAQQGGYTNTREMFYHNLSSVDNKMIIRDYTIEEE